MNTNFRIGFGYDVHAFAENRKLILGGIEIPYEKGLLGHSDADVLLHAICDALLGAFALGDIGKHFPDTDPKYKGADSTVLLKEVYAMITDQGYELANCDSTLVLEKPKLLDHIDSIREKIAELLDCSIDQISVKATTSEKMGFAGRGEGVAAYSTVLVQRK
ncbi:MAG: 2-C-methyl-D-erythritol 2,4-cyclodiphosphate synthase [Ignavibacteriae bacterium]|nr:2-C-methyl-D-erythritol 2,4-cyclodiphosphate synthase [Ignavibacteriota bacterium]NOG99709.1 2-C-methyl-D-erythritol 2,4-cyclodiphosphate synthase [Ignavibacteriota bacterium]